MENTPNELTNEEKVLTESSETVNEISEQPQAEEPKAETDVQESVVAETTEAAEVSQEETTEGEAEPPAPAEKEPEPADEMPTPSEETTAAEEEKAEEDGDNIVMPEIEEEETEKAFDIPSTNVGIIERLKELSLHAEQSEKAELDLLKQTFYRRLREKAAQAESTPEEMPDSETVQLEDDFKKIMAVIKQKRQKMQAAAEEQKEFNLQKKKIIIEKIKELSTSPEEANKAYEQVRQLQAEWKEIKPIPATAANEVWKEYQFVTEQYYDLLKTNNALRDYDYKKNLETKTRLCEAAEALADEEDIVRASRTLQELHQEYRETGPVAKELREELWNRFKAASTAVNKRHAQYFENLKAEEEVNLQKKTEICEKIESIETANLQSYSAWENFSKKIMELQAEWRTIGRAPKRMNNSIYERYRAACDNFFHKKTDFFKNQRKALSEGAAKRLALCEQAEALKDSKEWAKTTSTLIELQKAWKEVGPTTHKVATQLWERFNAACNAFFDEKKKVFGDQHKEEIGNLKAKKSIISELKELAEQGAEASVEKIKELMEKWSQTGHVPFKYKNKIYEDYKEVTEKLNSLFNLRPNLRRPNFHGERPAYQRQTEVPNSLQRQYETKKSELNTLETNVSFLTANSKKGNALIDAMQQKVETLKQEVEQLYNQLKEQARQAAAQAEESTEGDTETAEAENAE